MDDIDYQTEMSQRMRLLEKVAIVTFEFVQHLDGKSFKEMTPEDWSHSDKLWFHLNFLLKEIKTKCPQLLTHPMTVNLEAVLQKALKDDGND